MTANPSPEMSPSQSTNDAYWIALFDQEEALVPPDLADRNAPAINDWIPITQPENGRIHWDSNKNGSTMNPWQQAKEIMAADGVITLQVVGYNKGGLLVQWHGLQGFVPASQLVDFPQFYLESERLNALRQWESRELSLKIIELNRDLNRLILSERATLVKADQREQLLYRIELGQIFEGKVTNLTNFGAFIDLGGVEGLVHISEISWSRVIHPSDILTPDQRVKVKVLTVDSENDRVALSIKQLKTNPWQTVDQRFKEGQLIEGIISNVVSFGAFVMIEEELEGLIHISQLAEGTFLHPRNVVQKGQIVIARVLHVDGKAKRLALTLRSLHSDKADSEK